MLNQPRKTLASSVLVWLRDDLSRKQARAYWAGPHSQLVARSRGVLEYRQHHLAADSPGLWPALKGVETSIAEERRVDGLSEVILKSVWSRPLARGHNRLVDEDARNVFACTIQYATGRGGGRWYRTGNGERVGARVVVLLRRRDRYGERQFRLFVNDALGSALASTDGTLELRTQAFLPSKRAVGDATGVARDTQSAAQFHGSIVLGAADRDALLRVLVSSAVAALDEQLRAACSAIHAYDVEATYVFALEGRPTLPQVEPERKPRLEPVRRAMSAAPTRAKQQRSQRPFPPARRIGLSGSPEDAVVDAEGRVIGGAEGGRILRIDPDRGSEELIGDTGGRPLGLELLGDGRLLVCDAHKGLLRLDPSSGEIETLVRFIDGVPLRFCSNATATSDGTIWFTESTSRYDFEHYLGALLEHRPSGRLMRRDPDGSVEVVLANLHFANGVTLTQDESAVLFAETGAARISRLPLSGSPTARPEVIADNLPGYPDNLSRAKDGHFWAALPNPRDAALDRLGTVPSWVRKLLWRIPDRLQPHGTRTVWAMAFDEHGNVLADLQQPRAEFHMVTGVVEHDHQLYLVSPEEDALLALPLPENLF